MGNGTWRRGGGGILPISFITIVSPITFPYHIKQLIHILWDAIYSTYRKRLAWGWPEEMIKKR